MVTEAGPRGRMRAVTLDVALDEEWTQIAAALLAAQ